MSDAKIVNVSVRHVDGLQFVGMADSGHAVVMDSPTVGLGGRNSAPTPMELLLIGLGGCTGMDVVSVLKKKRQPVESLEVKVRGTKAQQDPARYTDVEIEFVIKGKGVAEEAVKRAIGLSMDKYCSVKATFEQNSKVGFTYKIIEE